MKLNNLKEFKAKQQEFAASLAKQDQKILLCGGTGCVAGGAFEIYDRFVELINQNGLSTKVEMCDENDKPLHTVVPKKSGCHGFCEMGPLVKLEPSGRLYVKVKPEDCDEIFEKSILKNETVERLVYNFEGKAYPMADEIPFYLKQRREVLENCGNLDAESIEEYIAIGGYNAFTKALFEMKPEEIVTEIIDANLRGRGGAGYPTGRKWKQVAAQTETTKFVVCNGDEGDPGAFMDRSIMEGDPHKMLEGMMIAAVATGAQEGYIYVRAEYPLAVSRLLNAIEQATEYGLLGDNILGTNFSFQMRINKGAGAFVCGEGSALTASIEGDRGMPRVKPPRTVEQGLFGKPTVLNNVETYANVAKIINNGSAWFTSIGTPGSPGTKAFALTGNVINTGLIEVPMGTTLREIIFDIGGGIRYGKKFKAVQIGGPSGGCLCLEKEHLDLPLDFDSLTKAGAMIGSGGLVVMDEDTCMVEVARFFMNFTQNESCGKCVPCREGTSRMLDILNNIVQGKGKESDIPLLLELADTITDTALCGLGKTAALPVVSTLKYFKDEYMAHIVDKVCPTKNCKALGKIIIEASKCKGCTKCTKVCPVDAISGKVKEPFTIDQEKCIKCGACLDSCPFNAIIED